MWKGINVGESICLWKMIVVSCWTIVFFMICTGLVANEWSYVCEFIGFNSVGGRLSSAVSSALTFSRGSGAWTASTWRLAAIAHGLHDGHCETVKTGDVLPVQAWLCAFPLPMPISLNISRSVHGSPEALATGVSVTRASFTQNANRLQVAISVRLQLTTPSSC